MTTLVRWNRNRDILNMRNEMDRLMESFFNTPQTGVSNSWGLAMDIIEDDKTYTITANVPGVKPEDIDITLEDGVLTVKGETAGESESVSHDEDSAVRYHLRERRHGSFQRSLRLPKDVDVDNVNATQEHGILTVTLPKSEQVLAKKITVK